MGLDIVTDTEQIFYLSFAIEMSVIWDSAYVIYRLQESLWIWLGEKALHEFSTESVKLWD
jgi:hypothetical protein